MGVAREHKFLAWPEGLEDIGGLIVDNKINSIIHDNVGDVLAGRAGQINSCQSPTVRQIIQANIIHSNFPSRRGVKFLLRLKTCRTPVPVMEGMRG